LNESKKRKISVSPKYYLLTKDFSTSSAGYFVVLFEKYRQQKINNICLNYKSKRIKSNKSIADYLNKKFKINPIPNKNAIKQLASNSYLNSNQVKEWFLNQRLKYNNFNKNSKKTYLIYNIVTHWFTYENCEKINLKALRILFNEYKKMKSQTNKQ
jgi:hypothetical protein